MLAARATLWEEFTRLHREMLKIARAGKICHRLMSTPGVGALVALTYRSAIDDPTRFGKSSTVSAYFGLTPASRRTMSLRPDLTHAAFQRCVTQLNRALEAAYQAGPAWPFDAVAEWMERDLDDAALQTGPADAPYWRSLSKGRLTMQKCHGCNRWTWPAVSRCGECGTWEPAWHDIALEGKLFSWTRTWHPFAGTEGIGTPFVTVLAYLPHAGDRRLLGLYEGDEELLKVDQPLVGRIATTRFGEQDIPAIRWLPA